MNEIKNEIKQTSHILKYIVIGVVVLAVLGALFFLFRTSLGDEVIARVGAEEITRHQVEVRERQLLVRGSQEGLSVPTDALFDRAIDTLIDESLVYQEAIQEGFSANSAEVDARYQAARDAFDSEDAFLERMKVNLLTPEEFRRNLERQIVLFSYLEELKRQKIQAQIDEIGPTVSDTGVSVNITADRTPLTQEEIGTLIAERTAVLKDELGVEVF